MSGTPIMNTYRLSEEVSSYEVEFKIDVFVPESTKRCLDRVLCLNIFFYPGKICINNNRTWTKRPCSIIYLDLYIIRHFPLLKWQQLESAPNIRCFQGFQYYLYKRQGLSRPFSAPCNPLKQRKRLLIIKEWRLSSR